jgi:hypothetical protein
MQLFAEWITAWRCSMVSQPAYWEGRMKKVALAILGTLPIVFACSSASNNPAPVASADAAILSARQAWQSIAEKKGSSSVYSKESAAKFEPYTATLKDGVWHVRGTVPPGYRGETLDTTVRQSDGSVSVTVVKVE